MIGIRRNTLSPGFTLIEVLITLVILAVGLLGVAVLQLKGLQFNHDATLRSQISSLAYDAADRLRLSGNFASEYVGSYTVTTGTPPSCNINVYPDNAANAELDRDCWHATIQQVLPPGSTASIAKDPSSNQYTVTIGWTDREEVSHDISYDFIL